MNQDNHLYIVLISVHGLLRGHEPELGRDPDTGGQILYVLDMARELARHKDVARVDILTRRINDKRIDDSYKQDIESIGDNVQIVRLDCGPRRYLRKEVLWPYLDEFMDKAIHHVRQRGEVPDIVHSHYADAGYVGSRLASLLGVPHVHTGHSLGRVKKKQLLAKGLSEEQIEKRYNISQRIEAEEITLDTAAMVVASTSQEVEQQYALYDNYHPQRMKVMPPGVDLHRFSPVHHYDPMPGYFHKIKQFFKDKKKPIILAMSRADERKNIKTLVEAYGESTELRDKANLVLIMGNRDNIREMDRGSRDVLSEIIMLIDDYDLYGKVAYPKHHESHDVPDIYRMTMKTRGVFINPALTEPFGLTLIEASACGVPLVVTNDGGPRDIIGHCKNGVLIDPLDKPAMTQALLDILNNRRQWRTWSKNGIRNTKKYYSWNGHVEHYIKEIHKIIRGLGRHRQLPIKSRLPMVERLAISAIDNCLTGDAEALKQLLEMIGEAQDSKVGFVIATGRNLESSLRELKRWQIPLPDVLITSVGSEIYYAHNGTHIVADHSWEKHIDYRWQPEAIHKLLDQLPGLRLRGRGEQGEHKISYFVNFDKAPAEIEIKRMLRHHDLQANVIVSNKVNMDILPIRASKGLAIRYLALKWGISLDHCFVAGDSGNDAGMLIGETLAAVVANHSEELECLRGKSHIYFAKQANARGVIEALKHYHFLEEKIRNHAEEEVFSEADASSSQVFASGK